MTEPVATAEISEQQIIAFLRQQPDWLAGQPDLLKEISLHDQSNGTISLADRQLQQLREENKLLKQDLNNFLANARDNEALLHKTFELCLTMLCATDLSDLFNTLKLQLAEQYDIQHVRMYLFQGESAFYQDRQTVKDALGDHFPDSNSITGRLRQAGRDFLFDQPDQVASVALIPIKADNSQGLLAFGSHDERHFSPENGDLFLQLFARTLTLWLNNHPD